ncbi:MAG: hypothetical protein FWG90_07790 [Oscillospiraceae bacterium]|nr:hypothetical protein [Oscillospiraceae bacterium]
MKTKKIISAITAIAVILTLALELPGVIFSADSTVEATGHDFTGVAVVTEPTTCEEDGISEIQCANAGCTEVLENIIPALGHDFVPGSVDIAADCEDNGKTADGCSRPGCDAEDNLVIRFATGHDWVIGDFLSTNGTTDVYEKTCLNCGATDTEEFPAADHTHDFSGEHLDDFRVITHSTCFSTGECEITCAEPGCTEKVILPIQLIPHHTIDEPWVITTQPGCTTYGVEEQRCMRASEGCPLVNSRFIDPLGHDWDDWSEDTATCVSTGTKTRECLRGGCGAEETEPTPDKGHTFTTYTPLVAATCVVDGIERASCDDCSVDEDERPIPATGHDFGSWVITTPATATATGIEKRTCRNSNCDEEETRIIPATGNNNSNPDNNGGNDNNSGNNSAAVRDAIISGGGIGGAAGSVNNSGKTEINGYFENDTYIKHSGIPLVYTADKNFADFREVRINGRRLTKGTHYTVKSGSTIITLLPEYLDTLEAGEHELSVHFSGLVTVNTSFTIANTEYDDVSTLAGILGDFDSIEN